MIQDMLDRAHMMNVAYSISIGLLALGLAGWALTAILRRRG